MSEDLSVFETYNLKFDEYLFDCLARSLRMPAQQVTEMFREGHPVTVFDIGKILRGIAEVAATDLIPKVGYKLVDLKMVYTFLRAEEYNNVRGATLIVGNNEVEKLNPNTIHLLQQNHHRVYLISVLAEALLDFLQLVHRGKIFDYEKKKWQKIHKELGAQIVDIIPDEEFNELVKFKESYRTSEFHKYSSVRGFISKERWDHFQKEQQIIESALARLRSRYVK